MNAETFEISQNKVIIKLQDRICETPGEILVSLLFRAILERAIDKLVKRNSFLLGIFERRPVSGQDIDLFIKTLGAPGAHTDAFHRKDHPRRAAVPQGSGFIQRIH